MRRTLIMLGCVLNGVLMTGAIVRAQTTVAPSGPPGWTNTVAPSGVSDVLMTNNLTPPGGQIFTIVSFSDPPVPSGALYHQVVDVFYDGDGNKLATKSYTHVVGADCQPGLRREDHDLLVQDDGKGAVRFIQARLPSEPAVGVRPVTAEGKVMAMLAVNRSPHVAEPIGPTVSGGGNRLADAR